MEKIILWARVLRIRSMGMLIYVSLHRLCLVNEHNAMINLKNDVVKKSRNRIKKIAVILALKKPGCYIEVCACESIGHLKVS
jgi:hypothetical protein